MPSKKDINQAEIEEGLRAAGAYVLSIHEVKNACDLMVFFRDTTYWVEIKNPEYAPKRKPIESKLTPGEAKCKDELEYAGGKYHIWLTLEQALKEIGAI